MFIHVIITKTKYNAFSPATPIHVSHATPYTRTETLPAASIRWRLHMYNISIIWVEICVCVQACVYDFVCGNLLHFDSKTLRWMVLSLRSSPGGAKLSVIVHPIWTIFHVVVFFWWFAGFWRHALHPWPMMNFSWQMLFIRIVTISSAMLLMRGNSVWCWTIQYNIFMFILYSSYI